jgi:hypothetical protein
MKWRKNFADSAGGHFHPLRAIKCIAVWDAAKKQTIYARPEQKNAII